MARLRFFVVVGLLAGCSAALPEPNASHVARLRTNDPEVSLRDLERGKVLYVERCSGCHTLKEPRRYSTEEWVTAMRKMEVVEGVKLETTVARDIERYLVALSSPEAHETLPSSALSGDPSSSTR